MTLYRSIILALFSDVYQLSVCLFVCLFGFVVLVCLCFLSACSWSSIITFYSLYVTTECTELWSAAYYLYNSLISDRQTDRDAVKQTDCIPVTLLSTHDSHYNDLQSLPIAIGCVVYDNNNNIINGLWSSSSSVHMYSRNGGRHTCMCLTKYPRSLI